MFYIFLSEPESFPISLHIYISRREDINKGLKALLKEGPALSAQELQESGEKENGAQSLILHLEGIEALLLALIIHGL